MNTLTKEWLQNTITSIESARDEIPFGLDEDQNNMLTALKIVLASLEREQIRHEHAKWSDSTFGCVGPHWSTETPLKRGSGSRSRTRRSQRVG
ncbi:hypothetical protein; probable pseudogene of Eaa phage protein [Escherichia coli ED1a]|uniref:Prophage protein n=1 Tax=Escherichia coli O81 (strain ED1a) TaxID=585397 RepID=B7MWY2_ECO81|nr:hypothetical protein; probable pseudogene of Eaa phage protein [Escherichia coli ED1a]